MKKIGLILCLAIMAVAFKGSQKGVTFRTEGWFKVSNNAKDQGMPIFAFVRTQSCLISKRMDQDVFNKPDVGKFFNENFVSLQMDADNTMDNLRVTQWGAKGVPTFFFFNSKKQIVYAIRGYIEADRMIEEAQVALKMIKEGKTIKDMPKEEDDNDDDDKGAKGGKKGNDKDDE